MLRYVTVFVVLAAIVLQAAEPAGYYSAAEGRWGAALRTALHLIISGHTNIPYSSSSRLDTSDALKDLDTDPANTNNVILIYARRSEPKTTFGLTTGWNREHMWPNSYGLDDVEPSFSDLHNLRPADANVNSARGNKFFDISDTNSTGYRSPAHAEAPATSTDSDSWEPPEVAKGEIARSLFYMAVRYRGDRPNEPALYLTGRTSEISATTNLMGRLATLLRWHEQYPVSGRERLRNDRVFTHWQGNRNPFVDRPEWVQLAFWPELTVTRSGTNAVISWPLEHADAVLEQASTLNGTWKIISDLTITTNNSTIAAIHPIASASLFFRLVPR